MGFVSSVSLSYNNEINYYKIGKPPHNTGNNFIVFCNEFLATKSASFFFTVNVSVFTSKQSIEVAVDKTIDQTTL